MDLSDEDIRQRIMALRNEVEQAAQALRGTEGEERDRYIARLREAIRNLEEEDRNAKQRRRPKSP